MLLRELQSAFNGVAFNGVLMLSPALDHQFIIGEGVELPFVVDLPTFAATAWYHKKLDDRPKHLDPFLQEVGLFAGTEYLAALFQGDSLAESRKAYIADKLHEYTGLSKTYIRNTNLRIDSSRFMRELLRDRGLVVGRLDTRYLGTESDDAGELPTADPFIAAVAPAFVAGFHHYLAHDLNVCMDREYKVLNRTAGRSWRRPEQPRQLFRGFLNVTGVLERAMAENKDLRVFVATGVYDLTKTYFSAKYMFNHSGIDVDRLTMKRYAAGHMMYLHNPSFRRLTEDLHEFVLATTNKDGR